tara:strand:+ start:253 stop:483 length:231 start_codon:yes stop_codon:yes gene_type:complete
MEKSTKSPTNNGNYKGNEFDDWLSVNGYFYIKTKDNRPCFKSKLTRDLKKQFQKENPRTKSLVYPISIKIFPFKSK